MRNENRVYVFSDCMSPKEKHVGDEAAKVLLTAHQFINGEKRFKFLRSYTPVITKTKTVTRRKGSEKTSFVVPTKIDETDVVIGPAGLPPVTHKGGYFKKKTEIEVNLHGGISAVRDFD